MEATTKEIIVKIGTMQIVLLILAALSLDGGRLLLSLLLVFALFWVSFFIYKKIKPEPLNIKQTKNWSYSLYLVVLVVIVAWAWLSF